MGLKQELAENDIVELRNGEIRKIKLQGDNSLSVVGVEDIVHLIIMMIIYIMIKLNIMI